MHADARLRRLAEMGVDVYRPRPRRSPHATPAIVSAVAPAAIARAQTPTVEVLLLADLHAPAAEKLMRDVARALAFAHVACAPASAQDADRLATASALVVFGEAQARDAGALLPAQRQRELDWVVSRDAAALTGDAAAKRALWSELKRMARGLAAQRVR